MAKWYWWATLACGHEVAGEGSRLDAPQWGQEYTCPEHGLTTMASIRGRNWKIGG